MNHIHLCATRYLLVLCLITGMTQALAESGEYTAPCSNGDFKGELKVAWETTVSQLRVRGVEYRITRSGGQEGGDKANILIMARFKGTILTHSYTVKSPDAMLQDGAWHALPQPLDLVVTAPEGLTVAEEIVQFVFDKSGIDPKCEFSTTRVLGD